MGTQVLPMLSSLTDGSVSGQSLKEKKKKKEELVVEAAQAMDVRTIWLMVETHCRESGPVLWGK